MGFKNFRLNVIARTLMLCFTFYIVSFVFFCSQTESRETQPCIMFAFYWP